MSSRVNSIAKPNFIIVGSAKCGTTTLSDLLSHHPDCCFSRPKEVHFFSNDSLYDKGWNRYKNAFSHYNGESLIGEATPNYTAIPTRANCAERIYRFNPNMKIIYIVRNPYNKLVSSWKMHCFNLDHHLHGTAIKGFDHYIDFISTDFLSIEHCRYKYQLDFYYKKFPSKNILVLFLEDWISNPEDEANRLFQFLGLDSRKIGEVNYQGSNKATSRRETRALFQYIGQADSLKSLRSFIPKSIRDRLLRLPIASRKFEYPAFNISEMTKKRVSDYLIDESLMFLEDHNKGKDFWDFSLLNSI